MTATILPFPAFRRRELIGKIVRSALRMNAAAGEQHIRRSLDLQATVMRRKGIAEDLIAKERIALESAVRQAIWDAVMAPRGVR
ncbi:DUF6074 family protein [Bradyrhizobium sp. Ai1a-2]|uniref:DUF6074 family protein n=1 Tax=Bradyrhizobium sp. Ai1a-2 TaxID=196490 RepID=UPI000485048B|nr:DUF6074 family protein [Bradyrhizobium sp. Ai1a-2]